MNPPKAPSSFAATFLRPSPFYGLQLLVKRDDDNQRIALEFDFAAALTKSPEDNGNIDMQFRQADALIALLNNAYPFSDVPEVTGKNGDKIVRFTNPIPEESLSAGYLTIIKILKKHHAKFHFLDNFILNLDSESAKFR